MCSRSAYRQHRAIIATEVVIAVALAMLVAVLAADAFFSYQKALGVDDWSRAVRWAAEGQLQRYQAGAELDSLPPAGVILDAITLETAHAPGEGRWKGLERITVTAEALAPSGRTVRAQISGYVAREDYP